ncbi:MAG: hypothetical protein ACLS6H_03265 [Clostridium sp.]
MFRHLCEYYRAHDDLGCYIPNGVYLKKWADQGVMLLNAVLTTGPSGSYHMVGSSSIAIHLLNEQDRPMVFIL